MFKLVFAFSRSVVAFFFLFFATYILALWKHFFFILQIFDWSPRFARSHCGVNSSNNEKYIFGAEPIDKKTNDVALRALSLSPIRWHGIRTCWQCFGIETKNLVMHPLLCTSRWKRCIRARVNCIIFQKHIRGLHVGIDLVFVFEREFDGIELGMAFHVVNVIIIAMLLSTPSRRLLPTNAFGGWERNRQRKRKGRDEY